MTFIIPEVKKAYAKFATGVCVAIGKYNNEYFAMTINSYNSVSLDPPIILFSIEKKAKRHHKFLKCNNYTISFLADDQEEISNNFAFLNNYKVEELNVRESKKNQIPFFVDSLAYLDLKTNKTIEAGDHTIFLMDVIGSSVINPDKKPLLYYNSNYSQIG